MEKKDDTGYISQKAIKKVIEKVGRHEGVSGVVLCDFYGLSLMSNMPAGLSEAIAAQVGSLVGKVRTVSQEISGEKAVSVRIETTKGDIEIIPDFSSEIIITALIERDEPVTETGAAAADNPFKRN